MQHRFATHATPFGTKQSWFGKTFWPMKGTHHNIFSFVSMLLVVWTDADCCTSRLEVLVSLVVQKMYVHVPDVTNKYLSRVWWWVTAISWASLQAHAFIYICWYVTTWKMCRRCPSSCHPKGKFPRRHPTLRLPLKSFTTPNDLGPRNFSAMTHFQVGLHISFSFSFLVTCSLCPRCQTQWLATPIETFIVRRKGLWGIASAPVMYWANPICKTVTPIHPKPW